jgi:putative peptidoglycan lipid II flippase
VLAAGTFLSRLSGFLRVIVAAYILGGNGVSDAYNFANNVPNIIYDLLLGGILSATLIPVFVDELRRSNRRERERAISAILTAAAAVLVVLSVALYLLAPLVIRFYLLLNHTTTKGDEVAVATSLLRLFAPQVFFLGAIVVSTALLNARRQFAAGAFSGAVNNVVGIAALVVTDLVVSTFKIGAFRHDHRGLLILGLGTTLGYVAQFLVQLPAMARGGLLFRPVWQPRHPAVKRVVGLSAWLVGVVVANQVSFNLIAVIAGQKAGQYTAYQYAYQFFQLPYALLAVSIASAIMPDLAARWSAGDRYAFLARVINGVRVTIALMVPAAIGYALVATPVVDLAIRHYNFNATKAELLAGTLQMFALGLPGFSAFLPLIRALQAMKDTRAMFFIYAFENGVSVLLAFTLYGSLGDRGLALAFVAPYTLAAIVTTIYLHRKVGSLGGIYTARSIGRTAVATAGMAIVVVACDRVLPHGTTDIPMIIRLVVDVAAGAAAYLLLARWLGIDDLQPVLRLVRPVLVRLHLAGPRRASRPASIGS